VFYEKIKAFVIRGMIGSLMNSHIGEFGPLGFGKAASRQVLEA
jgi:hypothetical protein